MVFLKKALTSTTCAAPKNRGLNLQVNPKKSKHPGVKKWLFVFENCLKLDSVTNVKLSGWHTTEKFDVMFPQHVLLIDNNIKKTKDRQQWTEQESFRFGPDWGAVSDSSGALSTRPWTKLLFMCSYIFTVLNTDKGVTPGPVSLSPSTFSFSGCSLYPGAKFS